MGLIEKTVQYDLGIYITSRFSLFREKNIVDVDIRLFPANEEGYYSIPPKFLKTNYLDLYLFIQRFENKIIEIFEKSFLEESEVWKDITCNESNLKIFDILSYVERLSDLNKIFGDYSNILFKEHYEIASRK